MTFELVDTLRDLYAASGGTVPGPAWTATAATILWMWAYNDWLAAGQHAADRGGGVEEIDAAFKETLAERLGWNDDQLDEFWNNPRYEFGPDDARRFNDSEDVFETVIQEQN